LQLDDAQSARAAFAQAAAIIDAIAAAVDDERLRSGFLNSEAVRGVTFSADQSGLRPNRCRSAYKRHSVSL
jgi:hypothetical protein